MKKILRILALFSFLLISSAIFAETQGGNIAGDAGVSAVSDSDDDESSNGAAAVAFENIGDESDTDDEATTGTLKEDEDSSDSLDISETDDETQEDDEDSTDTNFDDFETSPALTFAEAVKERLWAEVYFSTKYSSDERDNTIAEPWIKEGVRLTEINGKPLDFYIKQSLFLDVKGNYWSNRYGYGAGLRYKPFEKYGLVLFAELLRFHYTGKENVDYQNEDESPYFDLEAGVAFWQHWGKDASQIKNTEFTMPLMGWRELYADSLYYSNDNNWISTADYKEGIMLAKFLGMSTEGYINIRGSIDSGGEGYNNFIKAGPGIRLTPFNNFDLKVSFEYLLGGYYCGSDRPADYISDAMIILAFWCEF